MNEQSPSTLIRAYHKASEIVLTRLPVGRWLGRIAPFSWLLERQIMARRDHTGLHFGIYRSFAEAFAHIPPSRLAGWDHDVSSQLWLDQIDPVRPSTYPVLFWLSKLYGENQHLVDFGGSVGLTYYALRRYSPMPAGSSWTVVEVPKIAVQGRLIAQREQAADLAFVDRLEAAPPADILLSAGALQFMEESVPGVIERLPSKPRYILLNKLPLTNGEGFWTLQNYGPAVCPNQVYNEREFIAYFENAGYELRDRWDVQDLDCMIPFHPERFVKQFTGLLFQRRG